MFTFATYLSVGYWATIGSLSDYIIILPLRCWSWREWVVGVLVVDSFEFYLVYFCRRLLEQLIKLILMFSNDDPIQSKARSSNLISFSD